MKKIFYLILLLVPFVSNAATLRIDPAINNVGIGDVFVVNVRVEVDKEECVNAGSIIINYPSNLLRLNTLSKGESIFTLWLDEKIDHNAGKASFTSGIPGGYCGHTSGDPGKTNIIGKLVFQYIGSNIGDVSNIAFASETEVISNDGLGTKAELSVFPAQVTLIASDKTKNEWLEIVKKDTFPPEIFTPLIIQDTTIKDSPFVAVFDTIDKQSGVEHYEIVEEDPRSFGFRIGSRVKAKLSQAKSPYVLQDQSLSSRIVIRAYDHAGNMEEQIIPPKNMPPIFDPYKYEDYIAPILILALVALTYIVVRVIKKKKTLNISEVDQSDDAAL
jgi:hypothetical protein